jgi:hypothetical protein
MTMVIEVLEKIDRARVMVYQLNYGEREWKLSHPPQEDDPDMVIHEALRSAALEISRLSRELEKARKMIRELVDDEDAGIVWTGTRVVCAYCSATDQYDVEHDRDCPIERARRALVADTEAGDGE